MADESDFEKGRRVAQRGRLVEEVVAGRLADAVMKMVEQRIAAAEDAEYDEWDQKQIGFVSDEVAELREKRDKMAAELRQLERSVAEYPDLRLLTDMIEGRITYVVRRDRGYPTLMTFEEYMAGGNDLRSVVVFPVRGRQGEPGKYGLKFEGAQHNDGSGRRNQMTFCHSLEEAHRVVGEMFERSVALWGGAIPQQFEVRPKSGSHHVWKKYQETGVPLPWPKQLLREINDETREVARAKLMQAEVHLQKVYAEFTAIPSFDPPVTEEEVD